MFKKNDRVFHIVRLLGYILIALEALAGVVTSLSVAVVYKNGVLVLCGFGALIVCGIELLIMELLFSFLRDVKFIRNKLYGEDNSDLIGFGLSQNSTNNKKEDKIVIQPSKNSYNEDDNIIKYTIKDGVGIVAIQSKSISGELKISSQITSKETVYKVDTIGKYAFSQCKGLTRVEIPSSVTNIDSNAFNGCSNLKVIEIPNSVVNISNDAFRECRALKNITIPLSVKSIGCDAFANCNGLTIYCEAESQPSGWSTYWNISNCPVVWGYKPEQ